MREAPVSLADLTQEDQRGADSSSFPLFYYKIQENENLPLPMWLLPFMSNAVNE